MLNCTRRHSHSLGFEHGDPWRLANYALVLASLTEYDVDGPLLGRLMDRWIATYETNDPDWSNLALFRSLNMAHEASRAPGSATVSVYDVGRLLALWVSAFEVLVHPGEGGRADLESVYEVLLRGGWETRFCRELVHKAYGGREPNPPSRNAPCWIYGELYKLRNSFLHGNSVKDISLSPPSGKAAYDFYAAVLYRLALTVFLDLTWKSKLEPSADQVARITDMFDRDNFLEHQLRYEHAVCTAWPT